MPSGSWLVLGPTACGIICQNFAQRANWNARYFEQTNVADLLDAPLEQVLKEARCAIEHDPEEWQRACHWALMGDDIRFWSVVRWQSGDAQKWKSLVRAALQIASVLDEQEKEHKWGILVLENLALLLPGYKWRAGEVGIRRLRVWRLCLNFSSSSDPELTTAAPVAVGSRLSTAFCAHRKSRAPSQILTNSCKPSICGATSGGKAGNWRASKSCCASYFLS